MKQNPVRFRAIPWVLAVLFGLATLAPAEMLGPTPYQGFDNDSPFSRIFGPLKADANGRHATGTDGRFFHLEDYESGVLRAPGLICNSGHPHVLGGVINAQQNPFTDSVNEDNAAGNGRSFSKESRPGVPLQFSFEASALGGHLPTHAGIVLTDGPKMKDRRVVFEALDASGNSLGRIDQPGSEFFAGTSRKPGDKARFVGAISPKGIASMKITITDSEGNPVVSGGNFGFEVDHIQYGFLPSSNR